MGTFETCPACQAPFGHRSAGEALMASRPSRFTTMRSFATRLSGSESSSRAWRKCGRWGRPTADRGAPLECSRCKRRAKPKTWEVATIPNCAAHVDRRLVLACTLELTSTAGAQEVKPRAVRPPKNAAQPAPKPHVAAASPEDCGINSVIYWQAAARRCTSFAKVR